MQASNLRDLLDSYRKKVFSALEMASLASSNEIFRSLRLVPDGKKVQVFDMEEWTKVTLKASKLNKAFKSVKESKSKNTKTGNSNLGGKKRKFRAGGGGKSDTSNAKNDKNGHK